MYAHFAHRPSSLEGGSLVPVDGHRGAAGGLRPPAADSLRSLVRCRTPRPGRALVHGPNRPHALVHELLYAFALVGLGRIDVALRVGGDAVHAEELARLTPAVAEIRQLLQRVPHHDVHLLVAAIRHEEISLVLIPRERDVPRRPFTE